MSLQSVTFPPQIQSRILDYKESCLPEMETLESPFQRRNYTSVVTEPMMVQVPNSNRVGYSAVYRSAKFPDTLFTTYHPTVKTVYDSFRLVSQQFPNHPCLGTRARNADHGLGDYEFLTYADVDERRTALGSAIRYIVEKATKSTELANDKFIVTIFSQNSANWAITDIACVAQGLPNAVLYETLGEDSSQYILNFTKSPICFCSSSTITSLLKIRNNVPHLKAIVLLDSARATPERMVLLKEWCDTAEITLFSFEAALDIGRANAISHRPPTAQDVYSIVFTSGTTGNPKGALLTNSNAVASIAKMLTSLPSRTHYWDESQTSIVLCYLPLAHIYERANMVGCIALRRVLGFPEGDMTKIVDSFKALQPTSIACVPRLANRFATSLRHSTLEAPGLKGVLSRKAFEAKRKYQHTFSGSQYHGFWDKIWSAQNRKLMGFDRLGYLTCGSAPLSPENIEFLKLALATEILQGYGLTESMSGISITQPGDQVHDSVGPISATCEICLRDIPELNYYHDDADGVPKGEIMLRGPQIFKGYYLENEKTLESFDEDGWFHTGDVGKIDSMGRIYIIDRVKNFFKLAQGEYVGPERLESIYMSGSTLLSQIYVHGNSYQSYLVGIVGVNPEAYAPFVSHILGRDLIGGDISTLISTFDNVKVRSAVLKEINRSVDFANLKGYEKLRNIKLMLEPMTVDNETVTVSMKVRRSNAAHYFAKHIDELYKEGILKEKAKL